MQKEITVREIAAKYGYHHVYIQKLAREKGFPNPVRTIGRNYIFDADAVARFFKQRTRAT